MAPRKSTKNPSQAITEALDTPLEATVFDAAVGMGLTSGELRERLAAKLDNDDPLDWETVPAQHEPLIEQIARDLESEASVRRLTPPQEEPPQLPPQPEPLMLKDEPAFQITPKRKTSGITNKRKKSIGKQLQNIETIDLGIDNAEALNLVRDAAADGVELGQAQVLAKESARLSVRRKAYERTTAKLKEKAVKRAEYDPTDLLKQAGLQVSDDLLEDLQEFSQVSLGKFQTVFEEVTGDVWGNGYTNDFSDLDTQLDWSE